MKNKKEEIMNWIKILVNKIDMFIIRNGAHDEAVENFEKQLVLNLKEKIH